MALGALLVLCGVLYMARATIWRGSLSRPAGDTLEPPRQGRILGTRSELARRAPHGNRCNSVGVGGQFMALEAPGCMLTTPDVTRRANWTTSPGIKPPRQSATA